MTVDDQTIKNSVGWALSESDALRQYCGMPPLPAKERILFESRYRKELVKKIDDVVIERNLARAMVDSTIMSPEEETLFRKNLEHPEVQKLLFSDEKNLISDLLASGLERNNWKFPASLAIRDRAISSASR